MKLIPQNKLNKSLDKPLLKYRPLRSEIDLFKTELVTVLDHIDNSETEEFHKNLVSNFLTKAFYTNTHFINTKGRQDLVIHTGNDNKHSVGVIIEAKRPTNKADWFTPDKPNSKALQELLLYYLRERIEEKNIDIKYLIATNINEWYIIESSYFKKLFYDNKNLVKDYQEWRDGKKDGGDTNLFYKDIAKPYIDSITDEIPCIYFHLKDHEKALRSKDDYNNKELNALFKILSPYHLLKVPFANDSNELNDKFYKELLHIIGLEEAKEGGKNIIRRKKDNRNFASLLEKAIDELKTEGLHKVSDLKSFGDSGEEQYFNIALELCITWINRILFLKLLEGQLINYHKGDQQYRFLNSTTIDDFDELFKLFHKVLAVDVPNRTAAIQQKYAQIPYLNSSLFEISELEDVTIKINAIDSNDTLEYNSSTILKEDKKKNIKLNTIEYLFQFLDAYDFASEGTSDTQEDNRTLINASVLGKVFEKINGYKEGSFYTPGFITMYMSRQSIRLTVVQKFNDANGWACKDFAELENYIEYQKPEARKQANALINDLKLCDPAVGSGHFLVSALNEIIAIKSELKILQDINGRRLKEYNIDVVNDELIITDEDNELFIYNPQSTQSQLIQQTLFSEKQVIIENCLFGVDINNNSVKICRLRLWIELLKNAYYKPDGNLETLPNIDINIKCGNSLISRYNLTDDLIRPLKEIKYSISEYRSFVNQYKNCKDRDIKRNLQNIIDKIKSNFKAHIFTKDINELKKLESVYYTNYERNRLFEVDLTKQQKSDLEKRRIKDLIKVKEKQKSIEEIKNNGIFKNAFEWRFEFPEILNNNGDFDGFDLIIGNPPYIKGDEIVNQKQIYSSTYKVFTGNADLYTYFFEQGLNILKAKGTLSFITPNKWIQSNYGKELRKFIIEKDIHELIDFGELKVFDEASTFPSILMVSNQNPQKSHLSFAEINNLDDFSINNFQFKLISFDDLKAEKWMLDDFQSNQLINRIEQMYKPLGEIFQHSLFAGVKTGANEVLILTKERVEEIVKNNPEEIFLYKKICFGKDFKKYQAPNAKLKYLFFPYKFDGKTNNLIDLNDYPETLKYLSTHKLKLSNRAIINEGIIKKTHKWYELQQINRFFDYTNHKIIYPDIALDNRFFYDVNGLIPDMTCFFIPTENIEFVGILNSNLFKYLCSKYCPVLGNYSHGGRIRYKSTYLSKIPIPIPNETQKQTLISKTTQIFFNKNNGQDSTGIEKEIDLLVYQLYNLTLEEIAIVEQCNQVTV